MRIAVEMTIRSLMPIILLTVTLAGLGCAEHTSPQDQDSQDVQVPTDLDSDLDPQLDERIQDAEPNTDEEERAFELIEIQSPTNIRAWISPEITLEAFTSLEVPMGWIKNQPREATECGASAVRFIRSPDALEDGEILIEDHFGFSWFHSATITQMNVPLDVDGILTGVVVRKFHELTYAPGSCLILLISPSGEVYFRVGRSTNRLSDEPTLPMQWRIMRYVTQEELVIELFGENTVIRTDNQDSFQGPVTQLYMRAENEASDEDPPRP